MSKMVAFVVFGIVLGVFVALAATAVGVSFPFLAAVAGLLVAIVIKRQICRLIFCAGSGR